MATIMIATLMAVALMASLMMNFEKVFCRLKAIRFAMKTETFNRHIFWYLTKVFYLNVMIKVNMGKVKISAFVKNCSIAIMKGSFACCLFFGHPSAAQNPDAVYKENIKAVRFHMYGDQQAFPVYNMYSGDRLELNFDDLDANVKSYYYSFQLCDFDWNPVDISPFLYTKGFTQQRIATYRY